MSDTFTKQTEKIKRIWEKEAPSYDRGIAFWEKVLFGDGRRWVCSRVQGEVLEVAIGTGRNLAFYPEGVHLSGINLSPAMLERARQRARELGVEVDLREGDAQDLPVKPKFAEYPLLLGWVNKGLGNPTARPDDRRQVTLPPTCWGVCNSYRRIVDAGVCGARHPKGPPAPSRLQQLYLELELERRLLTHERALKIALRRGGSRGAPYSLQGSGAAGGPAEILRTPYRRSSQNNPSTHYGA
jgi:hypothetical protein